MTRRDTGFSLIEVLVSVFVFAIVGSISVVLLAASINAQDVNDDALARVETLDRLRSILREDLGQVVARDVRALEGGYEGAIFLGDAGGIDRFGVRDGERSILVFTRRGRANPGLLRPRSSLMRVEYVLRDGALIRRVRDYPDADEDTRVLERELLSGVRALELEFRAGTGWSRRVEVTAGRESTLPTALRLRYDMPGFGDVEHIVLTAGAI